VDTKFLGLGSAGHGRLGVIFLSSWHLHNRYLYMKGVRNRDSCPELLTVYLGSFPI
jgi:hypothetical protein